MREGEAMTNFESISNEEIKNEDPENLVWTRFVCLSSLDNTQLHKLAAEVREQAEEVRPPFEIFISGLKQTMFVVCHVVFSWSIFSAATASVRISK